MKVDRGRMRLAGWLATALAVGMCLGVPAPAAAQPDRPLRLVMNTELQVLDPHTTPAYVTRTFGYMVYDTLVATTAAGEYRPQMLDSWQASDDRLTWTFRLRPGLEWHDGAPVTAEDCVASLRRWGTSDGLGRQLLAATREFRVLDPNTFVLELTRPFSQVIEALGKSAPYVPFIMPARLAVQPVGRPVTEVIGSGPFLFRREEWRPGDRAVFHRNLRYRPRPEPADSMAGGKVVHIERAEFVSLPDPAVRANALLAGEVDYLEYAPLDFVERFQRNRALVVMPRTGLGSIMSGLIINNQQPPFNNPGVRRALQLALDQDEIIAGLGLPRSMTRGQCLAIFTCGGPFETEAGADHLRRPGAERARAALREAGYANERAVLLHSVDSALISPISLVVAEQMRRAGFNVEVAANDFSTLAQRRTNREPVERGGWSVMPLVWNGLDLANPLANYATAYNCTNNYPGWYCDPAMTPLLQAFATESNPARQRALVEQIQARVHEHAGIVFLGQFSPPAAYRASLQGVINGAFPVLWNIRRREG